MSDPLSNPVPRSGTNAYEPLEPTRQVGYDVDTDTVRNDPPVMRVPDGSAARAAIARSGIAQRPAPKVSNG